MKVAQLGRTQAVKVESLDSLEHSSSGVEVEARCNGNDNGQSKNDEAYKARDYESGFVRSVKSALRGHAHQACCNTPQCH